MKLPSLGSIGSKALKTFDKYPLPLAMAAATASLAVYSTEAFELFQYDTRRLEIDRISNATGLGVPLFLAVQLLPIAQKWKITLFAVIGAFLAFYANGYQNTGADHYANMLHFLAAIAAIIIAPFIFRKNENLEFWEWGRSFLLRTLTALLYSLVLFAGIASVIFCIGVLFVQTRDGFTHIELYIDTFAITISLVWPWMFLAGLPGPASDEEPKPYTRSLRAFALYVLLPIAGIYAIILYAYAIWILISWELPNGWVSSSILGFAGVGFATILSLYPLLKRGELEKRFARLPRIFFAALLPLLVLLYWAISQRISDYGITEDRYYGVVLIFWLELISFYFLIRGFERIKIIPISAIIILVLTSFGPWGAFSVSETSQTNRLINILEKVGALENGKLIKGRELSKKDQEDLKSINKYLDYTHNSKELQARLGITFNTDDRVFELLHRLGYESLYEPEPTL